MGVVMSEGWSDEEDDQLELPTEIPVSETTTSYKVKRNLPGTLESEFNQWEWEDINEMDGTLSVQQHLQQVITKDKSDIQTLLELPKNQDEAVWKYEHLRQFTMELGNLVVMLDGVCTAITCPLMKCTDEWEYFCAAHEPPQQCCAIDYFIHTLKQTADTLNDTKLFYSRVSIPKGSVKHFQSISRRLYRLFAHCFFHHREVFDAFEEEHLLCERFTRFISKYRLVPKKQQIIKYH